MFNTALSTKEVTMRLVSPKMAIACALAVLIAVMGIQALYAQEAPKITRSLLMKQDMTIQGRQAVMIAVELEPGAEEGRHTHPAELYVFVREGELLLESEGQPTLTYKAGDAFYVGPGKIHNGINKGSVTTKLVAMLIAEKGKPLSSPAK
jgi:quercetin dioxygenase-like cupin family protein